MLRYKTETRPGLVALYDIRPGNGAGPFLQPRSPHGAIRPSRYPPWLLAQYAVQRQVQRPQAYVRARNNNM